MKKNRVKQVSAAILLITGSALVILLVGISAAILAGGFSERKATFTINDVEIVPDDAAGIVTWTDDEWDRDRLMEPAVRLLVSGAYLRAWSAMGRFQASGDTAGIVDTFSGPAREIARSLPQDDSMASWSLEHNLTLTFYSLDGGTVGFRDNSAVVARSVSTAAGAVLIVDRSTADVVMVLDDGLWRVDQLHRAASVGIETVVATDNAAPTIVGETLLTPLAGPRLTAIEYEPRWGGSSATDVSTDFDTIVSLGFTAVRVGIPAPSAEVGGEATAEVDRLELRSVIAEASQHGLKVVVLLNPALESSSPAAWVTAKQRAISVIAEFAADPTIAMWDLADRPDVLATSARSRAETLAMMAYLAQAAREADPDTPITVSWGDPSWSEDESAAGFLDVLSLHRIESAPTASADVGRLEGVVPARDTAILLTGTPSRSGWSLTPTSEATQAAVLAQFVDDAGGAELITVGSLRDGGSGDSDGLLTTAGEPKVAAVVLGSAEGTVTPVGLAPLDYARSPLWQALGAMALVVIGASFAWGLRRRGKRRQVPPSGG